MITVTLNSCYPPGGLQSLDCPHSICSPAYYEPRGYDYGRLLGYTPRCYEPRGYSYIYGSSTTYVPPRRHSFFSDCYDPYSSNYLPAYNRRGYGPCDYSCAPVSRQPRYAYRRRYCSHPIYPSPCYNAYRALYTSGYRSHGGRYYDSY